MARLIGLDSRGCLAPPRWCNEVDARGGVRWHLFSRVLAFRVVYLISAW